MAKMMYWDGKPTTAVDIIGYVQKEGGSAEFRCDRVDESASCNIDSHSLRVQGVLAHVGDYITQTFDGTFSVHKA